MVDNKIDRGMIVEFGNRIYNHKDIEKVRISIKFKDGSDISFDSGYKRRGE